jgi:hypothetical protein
MLKAKNFQLFLQGKFFIHRLCVMVTKIVSAGFCTLGNPVKAYGYSESLGIESRPEDAKLISKNV